MCNNFDYFFHSLLIYYCIIFINRFHDIIILIYLKRMYF